MSEKLAAGMGNLNESAARKSMEGDRMDELEAAYSKKRKIKIGLAVLLVLVLIGVVIVVATSGGDKTDDAKVDPEKPDTPVVPPGPPGPDPTPPKPVDPSMIEELEATQMINVFAKAPDFSMYTFQDINKQFDEDWSDARLGGPVTGFVKKMKGEDTVEVKNNLLEEMKKVKSVKDTKSGFFHIKRLLFEDKTGKELDVYSDIQIQAYNLTDYDYDLLKNFELSSDQPKHFEGEVPNYKQFQHLLNGYARITAYNVLGSDEQLEPDPSQADQNLLMAVFEGRFENGGLTGYAREWFQKSVNVGFFEKGYLYGKGILYPTDAKNPDAKVVEGLFDQTLYKETPVDDFLANQEPPQDPEVKPQPE